MRRTHIANHDPKTHNHLHSLTTSQNTANTHLDNIHKVLHQNGDGTGTKPGVMIDGIDSSLNTVEANSTLTASRLSNIQDWVGTAGGDGTGVKTGVNIAEILVDTDQCVSKLTDISTNATLTASRLSNIQDWVGTSDGAGGGTKTGVNISSLAGCVAGSELQVDVVSGSVSVSGVATEAKQDVMETSLNAIETLLTTQATHNTNLLTKNTEIDTAVDLVNTNLTTIDGVLDNIKTAHDTHNLGVHSSHTNVINNATFTAGSYSSAMDILVSGSDELYRDITIYGKFDDGTSPVFHLAFSSDNVNYYIDPNVASVVGDGTNKHFVMSAENCPFRYVKVYNTSVASANNCYLYWVGLKHR